MKKSLVLSTFVTIALLITGCDEGNKKSSSVSSVESIPSSISSSLEQSSSSTPSSSSNKESSASSQEIIKKEYSFANFKKAVNNFAPTKISTVQSYEIESEDIVLSFNSQLVVAYGSVVKSIYTYSYEKLNELVTGEESMISVVSNTIYSTGSQVGDGVNFVTEAESGANLKGIDFKEEYLTYSIEENVLKAEVKAASIKSFFKNNYSINNVKFELEIDESDHPVSLDLSFNTNSYMNNLYAGKVSSLTTYSYNLETVEF